MSSLEALQTQLTAFQTAGRNLQLDPLISQKDLAQFGVPYQIEMLDELGQAIEDAADGDNKIVFTGHRGCGKSTLLAELGHQLIETGEYFVVMFSIADTIERSAVDHINILFSMALQLLEMAERRAVKLKPGIKRELYRWLGKHTQTESQAIEAEIEASGGASLEGGIPGLLKFLAEMKSKMKINSVIREEISVEFGRRISDLVTKLNEIKTYIENATGQKVLVIIDDLDKLDLSVTEVIFSKNIKSLIDPDFRIIYTIPIATLRELSVRESIGTSFTKIHTMRVAKFFSRTMVRNPDRVADPELIGLFRQILDRRLSDDLVEVGVKDQIIRQSGGVMRELIRIADLCCDKCMQVLRRQIREHQINQPIVTLNDDILQQVLTDLQISYAEPLGETDFEALKQIYLNLKLKDTNNQRLLDLLHSLYILEYRNAALWYDLNPIVCDLLVQEGVIDVAE
jgi:nucleoside-triphosphatase THEP1